MSSTTQAVQPRGIETRSIDWIPEDERHGRIWHQAPLWFLGNFQYFSIPIGFIGPALGLSLVWTIVAGTLGILTSANAVSTVFTSLTLMLYLLVPWTAASLIVSGGVYWWLTRSLDVEAEERAGATEPLGIPA